MGIVRWVLSHLVLILVIVAIGFGFVYRKQVAAELGYSEQLATIEKDFDWNKLWPAQEGPLVRVTAIDETASKAKVATDEGTAMKIVAVKPKTEIGAVPTATETVPAPKAIPNPEPAPAKPEPPKMAEAASAPSASEPGEPEAKAVVETASAASEPAVALAEQEAEPVEKPEPVEVASATPAAPPEAEPVPESREEEAAGTEPEEAPAPPSAQEDAAAEAVAASAGNGPAEQQGAEDGPSLREGWVSARRAFADGDLEKSSALYRDLMARYPDEPDLAGELGNLYLAQGRNSDAAAQFYEAGIRMLHGENRLRANTVLGVLNRLDPTRADALRKEIYAVMSGAGAR